MAAKEALTADSVRAEINKKYGPGALMSAKDMVSPKKFYTGSLTLDVSLNGGLSANHWTEIYGVENHGKTAVTLKMLAYQQRIDPNFHTFWVASEFYDAEQATALGVDTSRVEVLSTQDMAFAYQTTLDFLETRAADMYVIDSYPALIPPDEDDKDMDEYTRAEGAKMTNKFFRKAGKAGLRDPHDPTDRPWLGVFINQPRDSMKTVWTPSGQKPLETTPGGRGKNFAFYTRLQVARAEWITEGKGESQVKVGQVIRSRAIKHKGGPPERVASMDFYFTDSNEFERGEYDRPKDVVTAAVLMGVVTQSGAWFKFEDRKWQGIKNVLQDLRAEPAFVDQVEAATRKAVDNPHDKRSWTEEDVVEATTPKTAVRRSRRRKSDDAED
jgi:recombination protein RecA